MSERREEGFEEYMDGLTAAQAAWVLRESMSHGSIDHECVRRLSDGLRSGEIAVHE